MVARSIISVLIIACLALVLPAVSAEGEAPPAAGKKKKEMSPKQLQAAADMAAAKGDFKGAMKFYKKLIAAKPTQLAYYKRANANAKRKEFRKAINDLGKAVELDPKFWKGYTTRAKNLVLIGQCEEAVADIDLVLAAKPKNKQAAKLKPDVDKCIQHLRTAASLEASRQWNAAKEELTKTLEIAYESNDLIVRRARTYMAMNDYQSVLVDTREVLQRDKNNMDAMAVRAEAFYLEGEHDVALTHLKEGLRLDPGHKVMKSKYKQLRKLLKLKEEADRLADEKQFLEAAEVLIQVVAVDPNNRGYNVRMRVAACKTYIAHADTLMEEPRIAVAKLAIEQCDIAIELDARHGEKNIAAYITRGDAKIAAEMWQDAINDMTEATNIDQSSREARDALNKAQTEKKKAERKDYYKILGVPKSADDRAIKKAFRKLAVLWHPDKHTGEEAKAAAEAEFTTIVEAHDVLSDEETRGKYDRGEDLEVKQQPRQHFHHQNGRQYHFNF